MRTGMEQLVKGVNKCELEKKILLVEHLIGTEKRRENILNEYMTLVNSKSKKFWRTWHLVIIHEFV